MSRLYILLDIIMSFHGDFNFQSCVSNGFHNVLQTAIGFKMLQLCVYENDHRIHLWNMGINEAITLLNTFGLNEKSGLFQDIKLFIFFFLPVRINKTLDNCKRINKTIRNYVY